MQILLTRHLDLTFATGAFIIRSSLYFVIKILLTRHLDLTFATGVFIIPSSLYFVIKQNRFSYIEEQEIGNWEELLPEILYVICKRVGSLKELVAFGGVCSKWRDVAVEQNLGKPLLPFPWLMLAENQKDDNRDFYSVTEDKTYSFNLPELRGKKCMESKGWIVTVSKTREMALVNPMTRVQIALPHQNTSKIYEEHLMDPLCFVRRVVLSSPPNPENERDCVVAILHGDLGHLGFCRLGDKEWTVPEKKLGGGIEALEYYRGKFYVATCSGDCWEYDVMGKYGDTGPVSTRRIHINFVDYSYDGTISYLVESAGSLLVVFKNGVGFGNYGTTKLRVLEIDVELYGYKEVLSLETRAIFLGHSATLSVDTTWYPQLIPNSIYFTDDCFEPYLDEPEGGGMNMGIYSLKDDIVRPHFNGKSLSFICPPVWTFLTNR